MHSLKDTAGVPRLPGFVAAYPLRSDPRDALVSDLAADVDGLPEGAVVLTGSLRRRAQLLLRRPDLRVEALRGNVDTCAAARWRQSGAAALVLAAAGFLARLGHLATAGGLPIHPLPPEVMLPAPGQGTLALEARQDGTAVPLCAALDDPATAAAAAERHVGGAAFG